MLPLPAGIRGPLIGRPLWEKAGLCPGLHIAAVSRVSISLMPVFTGIANHRNIFTLFASVYTSIRRVLRQKLNIRHILIVVL